MPTSQVCINCHGQKRGNIKATSAKLAPLREAHANGTPVPWVGIHELADYAYFNHAVHIARGVGCVSCHGRVDQMEKVWHVQPLSMAWCLDCHRHWERHVRPTDEATNMQWAVRLVTDPKLRQLQEVLIPLSQRRSRNQTPGNVFGMSSVMQSNESMAAAGPDYWRSLDEQVERAGISRLAGS